MCLAIPGKIISINDEQDPVMRTGMVSFDGAEREVNLSMVPEARIDDYVMVHVGFALNVIDADEARLTLEVINKLEEQKPGLSI